MRRDWSMNRLLPIIFLIVCLMYVIMMLAFFAYENRKAEDQLRRARTIGACLGSRGHLGPGLSCWYDKPTLTQPIPLN
jgi:hypothetical protein